ncbi:aldehyde dehydrogenase family protein [Bacillus sp. AFS073361]|uniref:aldehyde dehydrogenase family protein n=1 Tax=Bacillus sp. AFS073361 TaxID=2033511 RepID=UPI00211D2D2F|nr:aldehyde dehydrogenase family protein [Bacillus sp. AFS073361]
MDAIQEKLKIFAPATGERLGEIPVTSVNEVDSFYHRSKTAFKQWSNLTMSERGKYLLRLKDIIVEQMEDIAKTIAADTGKVVTEALVADITPTLDSIDHIIKHGEKILQRQRVKTPFLLIGKKSFIEYMPRGVVLVISPWNYPFQLAMVPMLSALASGNTVILKPVRSNSTSREMYGGDFC